MAIENARKFLRDSQANEELQKSLNFLSSETSNILALAKELGYDFTPGEFFTAFIEEVIK